MSVDLIRGEVNKPDTIGSDAPRSGYDDREYRNLVMRFLRFLTLLYGVGQHSYHACSN